MKQVPKIDVNAPLAAPLSQSTSYEGEITSKNKFLYLAGTAALVIISLAALGLSFIFVRELGNEPGKPADIEVVTEEVTEEEVFDRADIIFEVSNGSGTTGAAKKAADRLEHLGYSVLKVGNTEETGENKLYLSENAKRFSSQIISDLEKDFLISTVSGELSGSTASASLILGKNNVY